LWLSIIDLKKELTKKRLSFCDSPNFLRCLLLSFS
jgi:hypothetical protein